MKDCIEHGVKTEGVLPGRLKSCSSMHHHFIGLLQTDADHVSYADRPDRL